MIVKLIVGVLQENCYIAWDNETKKAFIIDPGDSGEMIASEIDKNKLNPTLIINTHYHFDHTGANRYLKDKYKIPIAINRFDAEFLEKAYTAALEFMIKTDPSPKADILLSENKSVAIGKTIFSIIETPGHTKGSICLYNKKDKILFSGDTLFYESVGRWDLKGGNKEQLFKSLDKILKLPQGTSVYPGHGKMTTIQHELIHNPYKKGML